MSDDKIIEALRTYADQVEVAASGEAPSSSGSEEDRVVADLRRYADRVQAQTALLAASAPAGEAAGQLQDLAAETVVDSATAVTRSRRGVLAGLVGALVLLACGIWAATQLSGSSEEMPGDNTAVATTPDATDTTAAPATSVEWGESGPYWALRSPPEGYRAVDLWERGMTGQRVLTYGPRSTSSDGGIQITIFPEDPRDDAPDGVEVQDVSIAGRDAVASEWIDHGESIGWFVGWPDGTERFVGVVVSTQEGDFPDYDLDDVVALAAEVKSVDRAEWLRLRRALSGSDFSLSDLDAEFLTEVAVGSETIRVEALVPLDFPLGVDDARRTCVRVERTVDLTTSSSAGCDQAGPLDIAVEGERLVVGLLGEAEQVRLWEVYERDSAPDDALAITASQVNPDSVVVADLYQPSGPPAKVYVAVVPAEWCWTLITRSSDEVGGDLQVLGAVGDLPIGGPGLPMSCREGPISDADVIDAVGAGMANESVVLEPVGADEGGALPISQTQAIEIARAERPGGAPEPVLVELGVAVVDQSPTTTFIDESGVAVANTVPALVIRLADRPTVYAVTLWGFGETSRVESWTVFVDAVSGEVLHSTSYL